MSQAQKKEKFLRWKLTFQSLTPQSQINGNLVPVLLWGVPRAKLPGFRPHGPT